MTGTLRRLARLLSEPVMGFLVLAARNLIGNPWPATLPQVAFGTLLVMLGVLYTFLAKGWLR